jgi:hypothetical protein
VRPVNVHEMMDYVRSYLRITQARPTVVKNYFCDTSDTLLREECHLLSARSNNYEIDGKNAKNRSQLRKLGYSPQQLDNNSSRQISHSRRMTFIL